MSGIICATVDRPMRSDDADTRIVHAMADADFVTMRIDKLGVGDSEGPPCSEIDPQTGTTAVSFAPLTFHERPAALVPFPRAHHLA